MSLDSEGTSSISISDEPDIEGELVEDTEADTEADTDMQVDDAELPMVEVVPKDRKVRHDWYMGVGVGVGGGWAKVKADNTLGLTEGGSGGKFGGIFFLHAGGRLREKVYLGGRVAIAGAQQLPVAGASFMLEALYFPIAKRGLVLGAGVGPAFLSGTGDMGKTLNRGAAGLTAGIGYDFWVLKRLNLGVVLQVNAVLNNKQAHLLMGSLGFQVSLY